MEKRTLGRTRLQVTVLGYGAAGVPGPRSGAGRPLLEDEAERILNTVLDGGINFIDTSPDYGLSEKLIGKFIGHRRNEYYLATKCGCNIAREDPDDPAHIWTRAMLLENIETSLRLMKTDYVDLWQLHNPEPEQVEAEELVQAMDDVQRQGKVRHVAISSALPHINTYIEWNKFETYQIPYSALQREHEEVITAVAEAGAGTIIRGGVALGEPSGDLSGHNRWSAWEQANLDELSSEGESRSAFMLRFTITHPHLHTTIVGTSNPSHLAENLEEVETGPLPEDVYAEAKRRLDQVGQRPA